MNQRLPYSTLADLRYRLLTPFFRKSELPNRSQEAYLDPPTLLKENKSEERSMAGSSWRPSRERLDANFFTRNERTADHGYQAHTISSRSSYRDSRQHPRQQQHWDQYEHSRNGMSDHWQPQVQHQYFDSYYDPSYSQPPAPRQYNGPPPPGPPPRPPRHSQQPCQADYADWQGYSEPQYHQDEYQGYQGPPSNWPPASSSSNWRRHDQAPSQPPYYVSNVYQYQSGQMSHLDRQFHNLRNHPAPQDHSNSHADPGPSRRWPGRGDRSAFGTSARVRDSSSPRPASPRPVAIRKTPRASYLQAAASDPATFPHTAEHSPPPPLPLLVLDLNGTLVFRGRSGKSLQQSQNPTRRPYLSSFLAYCLGVEDQSFASDDCPSEGQEQDLDTKAADRRRTEWTKTGIVAGKASTVGPHGSHLWHADQYSQQLEASPDPALPPADPRAKYRLFVWSSAQPINVDSMVQAILHPSQAAQLMRCWARDTLVPERLFRFKSPSIKDLEVIWCALNIDPVSSDVSEGERRVMAEYRDAQDHLQPDVEAKSANDKGYAPPGKRGDKEDESSSLRAALQAEHFIKLPQQRIDKTSEPGRGYGLHNTLLLDDSQDKAKMQPYNHLFIPEFTVKKAIATQKYRSEQIKRERQRKITAENEDRGSWSPPVAFDDLQLEGLSRRARQRAKAANRENLAKYEGEQAASASPAEVDLRAISEDEEAVAGLDTVLLQTIGVLEHARWQRNVAAWIHSGGLGSFAGMTQPGVSVAEGPEVEASVVGVSSEESSGPRLEAPQAAKTEAFWEEEGRRVLQRSNIPIVI